MGRERSSLFRIRHILACLPPRFSIGYKNFVSFLDLLGAPDIHAQLAPMISCIGEDGVGLFCNAPVVIDKASLISHFTCIDANATPIHETMEAQVVIRFGAIITVNFTYNIRTKFRRRRYVGFKKAGLPM